MRVMYSCSGAVNMMKLAPILAAAAIAAPVSAQDTINISGLNELLRLNCYIQ